MRRLLPLVIWAVILYAGSAAAQDVEQAIKAPPVKLTGSFGMGGRYAASTRTTYANNFGSYAQISLNARFFGALDVPVSFRYSDQEFSFSRPSFQSFGLSPSYKWITVHGGYRSFQLSRYLLSGINMVGGGLDLKPGIFRFSAYYGNMARRYDYGYNHPDFAGRDYLYYKRKIIAGKIGVEKGNNHFLIHLMKAVDDETTGDVAVLDSLNIKPKENLAASVAAGAMLFRRLTLSAEVAASVMNEDKRARPIDFDPSLKKWSDALMPINESSRYYLAYNADASLTVGRVTVGLRYEHVDPNYAALGITYLRNNINHYLVTTSAALFRSKLNLSAQAGIQTDNSKNYFITTEKQLIYNIAGQYRAGRRFDMNFGYNNFSTSRESRLQEFRDSLYISAGNTGYNAQIRFAPGASPSGKISLRFSKNTFNLIQDQHIIGGNSSSMYAVGYSKRHKKSGLSYGITANLIQYTRDQDVQRLGGNVRISKKFGKKWRTRANFGYHLNKTDGEPDGSYWNARTALSYRIVKKGTLSLALAYRKRNSRLLNAFSALSGSANFNMSF